MRALLCTHAAVGNHTQLARTAGQTATHAQNTGLGGGAAAPGAAAAPEARGRLANLRAVQPQEGHAAYYASAVKGGAAPIASTKDSSAAFTLGPHTYQVGRRDESVRCKTAGRQCARGYARRSIPAHMFTKQMTRTACRDLHRPALSFVMDGSPLEGLLP